MNAPSQQALDILVKHLTEFLKEKYPETAKELGTLISKSNTENDSVAETLSKAWEILIRREVLEIAPDGKLKAKNLMNNLVGYCEKNGIGLKDITSIMMNFAQKPSIEITATPTSPKNNK